MVARKAAHIRCPYCDKTVPATRLDWDEISEQVIVGIQPAYQRQQLTARSEQPFDYPPRHLCQRWADDHDVSFNRPKHIAWLAAPSHCHR